MEIRPKVLTFCPRFPSANEMPSLNFVISWGRRSAKSHYYLFTSTNQIMKSMQRIRPFEATGKNLNYPTEIFLPKFCWEGWVKTMEVEVDAKKNVSHTAFRWTTNNGSEMSRRTNVNFLSYVFTPNRNYDLWEGIPEGQIYRFTPL